MEKSCGIVLFHSEDFLIIQHSADSNGGEGHWDFPKGHVEEGDDDHLATARREVSEETGITDVEIISNWFTSTKYTYIKKNIPTEKEVHWFPARTNTMNISLSEEHTDYIWIDVDSAEEMITFDEEVRVLQEARKILRF